MTDTILYPQAALNTTGAAPIVPPTAIVVGRTTGAAPLCLMLPGGVGENMGVALAELNAAWRGGQGPCVPLPLCSTLPDSIELCQSVQVRHSGSEQHELGECPMIY